MNGLEMINKIRIISDYRHQNFSTLINKMVEQNTSDITAENKPEIFNFSAGPCILPKEVLRRAQSEMLDWHGTGLSVMEMSHRGEAYISIAEKAQDDLRKLLEIPDNF